MRGRMTNVKPYICPSITPMATKFDRVATGGGGLHLQRYVTFTLRGHVTNEKNLYLHLYNTYSHQTWQSGNLH